MISALLKFHCKHSYFSVELRDEREVTAKNDLTRKQNQFKVSNLQNFHEHAYMPIKKKSINYCKEIRSTSKATELWHYKEYCTKLLK